MTLPDSLIGKPEIFQVELTSMCNMACSFCPHPAMKRDQWHMPITDFCRVASYFKEGQRVGLYMMGEPLLYPWLAEAVKITRMCGALPEIATNGLLLDSGRMPLDRFFSMGLSYVILDITRWKESSGTMDYATDKIIRAASYAFQLYNEAGRSDLPTLAIQIVENLAYPYQEFPGYLQQLAEEYSPGPDRPGIILKRKFLDSWAGQLPDLGEVSSVLPPEERYACEEPFKRVAVTCDMDVVPCCRDSYSRYIYGNLHGQALEQIWNGREANHLRSLMSMGAWGALPEPCHSCREWHIHMSRQQSTEYPDE